MLPTGGGESVYYQVPALIFGGLTLVVTPLGSLMEDQVGRAREVGLRANNLNSEQPNSARREIGEQVRDGEVDILFVSPERLDLAALRFLLEGVGVCLLAVDEAHCINEWARDSPRPAYRRIKTLSRALACPTLALRASATPEVREDILASLSLTDPLVVVRSFDRPNLSWSIVPGGARHNRLSEAYRCVRSVGGCAIVYAPTRCSIEVVRDASALRGVSVEAYHAGLSGVERTRVQGAFMEGECRVVVATNAFGMGIDKPYVLLVVHVQLPGTLEAYYEEAGRTGRDGRPSACVAFSHHTDRRLVQGFIDRTHPPQRFLWRLYRALHGAASDAGFASVEHPKVVRILGPAPFEWMSGEPVGPLAALERAGAIRRAPPAVGSPASVAVRRRTLPCLNHS